MQARTSSGWVSTSKPATLALPAVARSSVQRIWMVVVLPAPLGPRNPKLSPGMTSRSMPRTASTRPYVFTNPRTAITGERSRERAGSTTCSCASIAPSMPIGGAARPGILPRMASQRPRATVPPAMASAGVRGVAAPPLLLCAGLAAAVTLRLGVAGSAGPRSAPAGAVFGVALLGLALTAGWRPGRVSPRPALIGLGGAAVLLAVPVALHLRTLPLQAGSPAADLPLWAVVVTLVASAEEALLRGALMDALLRRARPELAAVLAAMAFAALHVPLYGWAAVPLDLAAGVWLGGLRLQSGGAGAPALAHTVADLASWWLR